MYFFSYPPLDPTTLSRASENNFTGLLLSKQHYTCGFLVLVLVSCCKNKKKYWVDSATPVFLTPHNITIIRQIINVLRSLKKKETFSFNRVTQIYILKFSSLSKKGKTSDLLKQYWDICHLLPSKACVDLSPIFLLLKNYFQLILYHLIFQSWSFCVLMIILYYRCVSC